MYIRFLCEWTKRKVGRGEPYGIDERDETMSFDIWPDRSKVRNRHQVIDN